MLTPYLTFNGNCKDVLNFYRTVFHCGEPKVQPYGDYVTLLPTETFYSVFHAAVTDKFGVNWNVVAEEAPKQMEG